MKLVFRTLACLFIAIFLLQLIQGLLANSYDWDIDHEMYYGSRLLKGELLFTKEYHEKFPVVQYLFAIPAAFKSVSLWVFISAMTAIAAASFMFNEVKNILRDNWPEIRRENTNSIAFLASTFYLFLVSTLQGNLFSINCMASSLTLLAICFQLNCSNRLTVKSSYVAVVFMISALIAAVAISIRPYLAPSLVMLGIWIPLRKIPLLNSNLNKTENCSAVLINREETIKNISFYMGIWIFSLVAIGSAINILPYLLTFNLEAFYDGILYSKQHLLPQGVIAIIASQLRGIINIGNTSLLLSVLAFIVPTWVFIKRLIEFRPNFNIPFNHRLAEIDLVFSGLIPALLLEITILGRHFWPHYIQLFSPFVALSLAFSTAYIIGNSLLAIYSKLPVKILLSLLLLFSILSTRYEIVQSLNSIRSNLNGHTLALYLKDAEMILQDRKLNGQSTDFLDASNMYVHWKLGESRHGFPSSTTIDHIFKGWLINLQKSDRINLPNSPQDLCSSFAHKGPTLIFADTSSLSFKCLSSANSSYNNETNPEKMLSKMSVFVRKS